MAIDDITAGERMREAIELLDEAETRLLLAKYTLCEQKDPHAAWKVSVVGKQIGVLMQRLHKMKGV